MNAKQTLLTLAFLALFAGNMAGQVTIGSGEKPVAGALLDLKQAGTTTKGLGMPRVALQGIASLQPCANETLGTNAASHVGLMVYNTSDAAALCPGLYVWDSAAWTRLHGTCDTRMAVSPALVALNNGTNQNLSAIIYNDSEGATHTYTWSSSNPAIASVDANGKITAHGKGSVIITATDGTLTATSRVIIADFAGNDYRFRLHLADKGNTYSINEAHRFLTQRAIDRRARQGIAIDYTDLPISLDYLKAIEAKGGIIAGRSKWLNTVAVHCRSLQVLNDLMALPFVADATLVWEGPKMTRTTAVAPKVDSNRFGEGTPILKQPRFTSAEYAHGWNNVNINNGQALHDDGKKGEDMEIAVIDAGFTNISALATNYNIKVKGSKSFLFGDSNIAGPGVYGEHGIYVLSCMGANKKGTFVGTAPEASYWLLRTEDPGPEYPVQEDYWLTAAEYADSVGVDLINSSLGYKVGYVDPSMHYTHAHTDGNTIFLTRGADMAVEKGIAVVCSAGNDTGWVSTPGEGRNVLTVGGLKPDGVSIYGQSSRGMTADGRFKPDVVALGEPATMLNSAGVAVNLTGTSFSAPIMCGMAACLWQKFPTLTAKELFQSIRESSDRYGAPALPFGYGKPNMGIAIQKAQAIIDAK